MSRKNSKFNNNTKLYIKQFNKLLENQKEKQQWTQNHLVELINKNINPQSRLSSKAIHIVLKKQNKYDVFQYNNNFVSYIFVKIESEKQKKIKEKVKKMQEKENEEYLEDLSKQQTAESERIVKKELEE